MLITVLRFMKAIAGYYRVYTFEGSGRPHNLTHSIFYRKHVVVKLKNADRFRYV